MPAALVETQLDRPNRTYLPGERGTGIVTVLLARESSCDRLLLRSETTHLLTLRQRFPGAPYICVSEQEPTPAIPQVPVVLTDWMQRMPIRAVL